LLLVRKGFPDNIRAPDLIKNTAVAEGGQL
jgi:hypothetical protein